MSGRDDPGGAVTVMPSTVGGLSDAELVALFLGDELSEPAPSPTLAFELCRRLQPADAAALRLMLYGSWPVDEIPLREREALFEGFAAWRRAGRPC